MILYLKFKNVLNKTHKLLFDTKTIISLLLTKNYFFPTIGWLWAKICTNLEQLWGLICLCLKNNYHARIDLIELEPFKKAALVVKKKCVVVNQVVTNLKSELDAMILFRRGKPLTWFRWFLY